MAKPKKPEQPTYKLFTVEEDGGVGSTYIVLATNAADALRRVSDEFGLDSDTESITVEMCDSDVVEL